MTLTSDEIAGMRDTVAESLPDTVGIDRITLTVDAEGNPTGLVHVADVAGWLVNVRIEGADSSAPAGVPGQRSDRSLVLAIGTDIRPGDRVTINASAWHVLTVVDNRTHLRAELERIAET